MPRVHREAIVPYSAEQMFALVNDVERYPEFLPGCASAEVLDRSPHGMRAKLTLAKAAFKQSFTTVNQWRSHHHIEMRLADGPFKQLHGAWQFVPLGSHGCRVTLTVDFEFASLIGGLAFGGAFQKLVHSLMDAFQGRARSLYGQPSQQ